MTILRDLTLRAPNGNGILGTNLVGVTAAQVAKGFAVAGLLENHVSAGDPAGCLYRVELQTTLGTGTLAANEDGSFQVSGLPANSSQTLATKVYKNNVAATDSIVFNEGTPSGGGDTAPPTMNGAITVSPTTSGGTATWQAASDNVGVTGYEASIDTGTPSWVNVGLSTTYSFSGKNAGTGYTFRLRAYDAAGLRATPITKQFKTLPAVPHEPGAPVDIDEVSKMRVVVFEGTGSRVVVF